MAEDKTNYELDSQVDDDFDLDDLESMPGFVVPPSGVYMVTLTKGIEEKDINDVDYYEVAMTIDEVIEFDERKMDPGEEKPKAGDIATTIFSRTNKFGMSNFKNFARSIAEKFQLKKVGQVKDASKGLQMMVVLKRRYDKKAETNRLEIVRAQVV